MKYRVEYLNLAMEDVAEIKSYLSQFYTGTPVRFLNALKQAIENLCEYPFIYVEYVEYADNPAYRKLAVLDYLVFYKVFEQEGIVEIHRVLYGRRDIKAILS